MLAGRLFHKPSIAAQQVVEWFLQLHDLTEIWGFNTNQMIYMYDNNRFHKNYKTFTFKLTTVDSGRFM